MQKRFDARLDLIPKEPGVYLMKDDSGSVIYVGKAKNLPKRLQSYFRPNPTGDRKVLAMISHIADFEYVVCNNELEALILENNLIKQYRPHYNILLRDDKEYPYIKVTLQEMYPRVFKVFHQDSDKELGAKFYGPYLAGDLNRALQALHRIYPLRTCKRQFPRDIGKKKPCLYLHIGRCIGPCTGEVSEEEYNQLIEQVCSFLDGNYSQVINEIKQRMQKASNELNFEQAALWRDRLYAVQSLVEKQVIVTTDDTELDAVAIARNDSEICVQRLEIRQGRMVGSSANFLADQNESEAEILSNYLRRWYGEQNYVPRQILIPTTLENQDLLVEFLQHSAGKKVQLYIPKRGDKKRILEMAQTNASESLKRHTLMGTGGNSTEEAMQNLTDELGLEQVPQRIEAFDIANLGKSDRAASMVVFTDGKPKRSLYRHFKVQIGEIDDYEAMRSVLERRLKRLGDDDFAHTPQLILIDGGIGHLNAVKPIRDQLAPQIPLAGIVKDERHRTRGLVSEDGTILELRATLQQAEDTGLDPLVRAKHIGLLRLLTAIQDEAHRFAGRLQKKLGEKRVLRYSLENIAGVGKVRRKALLQHFRSIKNIAEASLAELNACPQIDHKTAEAIYQHFHGAHES